MTGRWHFWAKKNLVTPKDSWSLRDCLFFFISLFIASSYLVSTVGLLTPIPFRFSYTEFGLF